MAEDFLQTKLGMAVPTTATARATGDGRRLLFHRVSMESRSTRSSMLTMEQSHPDTAVSSPLLSLLFSLFPTRYSS